MIKKYIIERRSWIILFLFLQLLVVLVAYLDAAIPLLPLLYIVFLSTMIFLIFFIIRYHVETKYYRSLQEWDTSLDLTRLAPADRPFEKIIESSVIDQTERLKQDAAQNMRLLEQEKDDLLSWIHEVKTPLTAMHLMIERLDDEKMKAHLTYEWLRIHLLLDQQLHQKRLPFMKNDLFIEKVSLKSVIFKEIKALQSWCIQKGIGFDVELKEEEVLTDAKWLAFIIRQLLTNAVKYSEESDIIITSTKWNGQTVLKVQDFGRGIDPRDLPRIFDKGFTSTSKHQDSAATGMGLYLAKKAAEPLLISIQVCSKTGEGSTFTLSFPERNDFDHIAGM
ncbi:sensor histidine kinase [Neobacillus sp. LXY-1]|uniref:sensor histidine kinase n=1 Tax=Neobacillus sp. LXY-1 TaxID=3379133 RepID=UPI003EE12E9C